MLYRPNQELLDIYETAYPFLSKLQEAAFVRGIPDIFQDNGGKTIEICARLGLTPLPGREGNDAKDSLENEYEIKTVNLNGTVSSYSIHHTVTENVLQKYEKVYWIFAEYRSIHLEQIFVATPQIMAKYINLWRTKKQANPKFKASIPIKDVREIGTLVWSGSIL